MNGDYVDLAPNIFRQRLVVEGIPNRIIIDSDICDYLKELGVVCKMNVLTEPVTHESLKFGWSGWVHWETSGVHFYAWEKTVQFFSADIYTCKQFSVDDVVNFTKTFFGAKSISFKEL